MKGWLSRIISLVVIAAIVCGAIYFVPKLVHKCDKCDALIIGTGYEANIVSNALSDLGGKERKIICKNCAEKEHALGLATGKTLDDFKIPLFEE